MITFLHPWALWALPLAGFPLVLHFWGRGLPQTTPFSAVDLLRDAARDRFSMDRLQRWLLLLVRIFLLAAFVLFLAGPGLRGVLGAGNVRAVILLDASYSLHAAQSGETAFDRSRSLARTLVQTRRGSDRWGLVVFSDQVETSFSPGTPPQAILHALDAARPTFRETRFSAGFREAEKFLAEGGTAILLSDLAAHGLSDDEFVWDRPGRHVVAVEVVPRRVNAGVAGVRAGGPGDRLRADIQGWGSTPSRGWTLRQASRVVARGGVRWENGLGKAFFPSGKGAMEFVLDEDVCSVDDHWFFIANARKSSSVLLVNGAPSLSPVGDETYFIRPALEALSSRGISVDVTSPGDLSTRDLSEINVVALLNPPPLPASAVDRLKKFVDSGGGLWMTAGDRGGISSLHDLSPIAPSLVRETEEGLALSGSKDLHGLAGFLWDRVRVDRVLAGELRPGATVALETVRSKIPVLFLQSRGRGRIALWGATVDRDWTNLPSKPSFPVLVGELVGRLSGSQKNETRTSYFVGEAIERMGWGDRPPDVFRPDGRPDQMVWAGDRWRYEKTDAPGIYGIRGSQNGEVAVNARVEKEGDLSRMTREALHSRLKDVPVQWIPSDRTGEEEIRNALRGRDLTFSAAMAVFVLAMLETLFLVPRKRRA